MKNSTAESRQLQTNKLIQFAWTPAGDFQARVYDKKRETVNVSSDDVRVLNFASKPRSRREIEDFIEDSCSFDASAEEIVNDYLNQSFLLPKTHPVIASASTWFEKGWRRALYYTIGSRGETLGHGETDGLKIPGPSLSPTNVVTLPEPIQYPEIPFSEVLVNRRTVRDFNGEPITTAELSRLLVSTFDPVIELRDTPLSTVSPYEQYIANGIYPLVFILRCEGVQPGLYQYNIVENELGELRTFDTPTAGDRIMRRAVTGQQHILDSAAGIILCGEMEQCLKLAESGKGLGSLYCATAVLGHRFLLTATALGLRTWQSAAFNNSAIYDDLHEQNPLYLATAGNVNR